MSESGWVMIALLGVVVVALRGWPRFITIHKHYYKGDGNKEETR